MAGNQKTQNGNHSRQSPVRIDRIAVLRRKKPELEPRRKRATILGITTIFIVLALVSATLIFTRYKERIFVPPLGMIKISSTPSEAKVFLNGKFKGETPIALGNLNIKNCTIKLTREGYKDWVDIVEVKKGKILRVKAILEKARMKKRGGVVATSSPPQAIELIKATKIIFIRESNIWTMNPDGGNQKKLTNIPKEKNWVSFPRWSPDKKNILYTVGTVTAPDLLSSYELWTMKADGTNQQKLAGNFPKIHSPQWSKPKGDRIIFATSSNEVSDATQIWEIKIEGGSPREITPLKNYFYYDLALSPDGTKIVFTAAKMQEKSSVGFNEPDFGSRSIWIIDFKKTNSKPKQLTNPAQYPSDSPAFSPDGKKIAFIQHEQSYGGQDNLWIMNVDGSDKKRLTNEKWGAPIYGYRNPVWSPQGKKIALMLRGDDYRDLFVVNADGKKLKRLTRDGASIFYDWSPNGERVIFGADLDLEKTFEEGSLYKINIDGKDKVKLVENVAEASWSQ